MKSFFAPLAAAVALAGSVAAQLTINTPLSVVVCQPLLITWSGGTPPYFLSVLPGNQPSAAALLDFGTVTGQSLTWTVNITAGTSLGLNLRDSTGTLAQSAAFTVQSSSNTACLNGGASSSGPSTTGSGAGTTTPGATTTPVTTPPTTSAAPTTTAPTTTPATTTPTTTPGSSSATTPATTSATTSATPTGAASQLSAGVAGILGAGAAVMALLM